MPITFNANEIFEMAEEIEKNGAVFYRKAAENTSDEKIKKMLLYLVLPRLNPFVLHANFLGATYNHYTTKQPHSLRRQEIGVP